MLLVLSILYFSLINFFVLNSFEFKYPKEVGVKQSCILEKVDVKFFISNFTNEPVNLFSFDFDNKDFELYISNILIQKSDTFKINKFREVEVNLKYKIYTDEKPYSKFIFKSDKDGFYDNEVKVVYGSFYIDHEKLRNKDDQTISVSQSCSDSIRIYFYGGGTETNIVVYPNSEYGDWKKRSTNFGIFSYKNFITFSITEIGKHRVFYGTCSGRYEFDLTLK